MTCPECGYTHDPERCGEFRFVAVKITHRYSGRNNLGIYDTVNELIAPFPSFSEAPYGPKTSMADIEKLAEGLNGHTRHASNYVWVDKVDYGEIEYVS